MQLVVELCSNCGHELPPLPHTIDLGEPPARCPTCGFGGSLDNLQPRPFLAAERWTPGWLLSHESPCRSKTPECWGPSAPTHLHVCNACLDECAEQEGTPRDELYCMCSRCWRA